MSPERLCAAHSKRTGRPCQHAAMHGRRFCYHHGGKNPRGIASPRWKHGRYSEALPPALLAAYERARADPDLVALRDELALVDARLTSLLADLTAGGGVDAWATLRTAWQRMERAQGAHDTPEAAVQLRIIRDVIQEGAAAAQVWAEVYETVDLRRRLADTERKRLEALQATVTAERAMALIGALAASLRKHVSDRTVLAAITADIELVLRATPEVARAAG